MNGWKVDEKGEPIEDIEGAEEHREEAGKENVEETKDIKKEGSF